MYAVVTRALCCDLPFMTELGCNVRDVCCVLVHGAYAVATATPSDQLAWHSNATLARTLCAHKGAVQSLH